MILLKKEYIIDPDNPLAFGEASSNFKKTLKQLGIPSDVIKRTAIAMYEAEINTIIHGKGGRAEAQIDDEQIRIVFKDEGPGIPDIEMAMQEGFSTASSEIREMGFGAGLGLPNIKKNSSNLSIESEPGKGTKVTIIINL
ncbi:MAG: ATP-binding protein [Spirochaetales bacterium]|nr:ATP-binding protein [Spirochaetales bacterium]